DPPPRPSDVEGLIRQEESAAHRVDVPDQLRNPHPLVHETSNVLKAAKADETGIVRCPWSERCLDITVAKENLARSLRIMTALARAIEVRGWSINLGKGRDEGTRVGLLGQTVQIAVIERTIRSEHVATKKD